MSFEYIGDIMDVRTVEDCIRATRKYTKSVFKKSITHPIQGEAFPSRVLTEYYEVYPDLELSLDMVAADAWAWVLGERTHIDVYFRFNYLVNKAWLTIQGGNGSVESLGQGIPGFREALEKLEKGGRYRRKSN